MARKNKSGVLEQSAEWLGRAAGTAARQVRRAAGAVGLETDTQRMAGSVRKAANATTDTIANMTRSAVSEAQRTANTVAKAARTAAADRPRRSPARRRALPKRAGLTPKKPRRQR
jgi:hypothetical protein